VTYGVRWDVDVAPSTASGLNFPAVTGFSLTNLDNLALAPNGTPIYNTRYGNFAPRIGGAYQLSQGPRFGSVFRAGFGVFYDLSSTEVGNFGVFSYPFFNNKTVNNVPFPTPASFNVAPPIVPPDSTQGTLFGFDPHLNLPYLLQWSAALEQELGSSQTLTFSYIGSAGKRLLLSEVVNNPNPNYVSTQLVANQGSSNYNTFQAQFQRRLSHGLQALASYSFSHSIDTGSYGNYADGSFANVRANRGNSDFDIRNSFSAALTYNIPAPNTNAVTRALLGGWSTENIFQVRSAPPASVIDGSFSALTNQNSSIVVRPDVVSEEPLYLYGPQYPGRKALNPNAFTSPPVDSTGLPLRQGDLARNSLLGFGLTQWDFAAHRDLHLREKIKLQFRAEMFNVINHPNFSSYDTNFGTGDPSFGMSTAMLSQGSSGAATGSGGLSALYQLGGPRSIQLALKLVF
jgi:hypothetical protein